MHNFYCPDLVADATVATLPPEESRHALQVLRHGTGDHIMLFNGFGLQAEACINSLDARRHQHTTCQILRSCQLPPPRPMINLYLAPPKSKVIDQILRIATELGVFRIIPLHCRFGVSRPDQNTIANWQRHLLPAAKQSGNPWLPQIMAPVNFDLAVANANETGFYGAVPTDERETETEIAIESSRKKDNLALWVGPEGGFAPEELQKLQQKQLQPLTVGQWILRVETAVPALLAVIWHQQQQK